MNHTLIIVKPHAVVRGLTGEFIARFEKMNLNIKAIKHVSEPASFWDSFYPSDESWFKNVGTKTIENNKKNGVNVIEKLGTDDPIKIGKMVKRWLVEHMASNLSIAVCLEGNEALTKVRTACGSTLPNVAQPGTIRFEYSSDSPTLANEELRPVYNLIHASDPEEVRGNQMAVEYELEMFFPELDNKS